MIESDTIKLLRECDLGIKMGVSSIQEVMDYVKDAELKVCLKECSENHSVLKQEIESILNKYQDQGKNPNPMVKCMAHFKTNLKLLIKTSDAIIADLMTNGCNMGVKSLHRYLNQYKAADEESKNITKRLVALEEKLIQDLRAYL